MSSLYPELVPPTPANRHVKRRQPDPPKRSSHSTDRQLVEVEKQKAEIKITETHGIAKSQDIINAALTNKYLQHQAIQAQEKMADSPNHTTIYIPSGHNGIPPVHTTNEPSAH